MGKNFIHPSLGFFIEWTRKQSENDFLGLFSMTLKMKDDYLKDMLLLEH